MSVKLRVSYERPEELRRILQLLHPDVKRWKAAGQTGRFKRAYVELREGKESDVSPDTEAGTPGNSS